MPRTKKLQKQIEKKLDKLQELLGKITETNVINPNDTDTWDNDALYDLVEKCKEVIKLLEDQEIKDKYDEFGQPLYEEGLCSLMDEYYSDDD